LARRLEVPRERVSKWERGSNAPSLEDLGRLSEVLAVPLEELGLGCPAPEPLGMAEMDQLVDCLKQMVRLVRPWVESQRGGGRGGGK
jgi:transcriptional regulator with XRE-family HTH domain